MVEVFSVAQQCCIFYNQEKTPQIQIGSVYFELSSFLHWLVKLNIDVTMNCYARKLHDSGLGLWKA